MKQILDDVFEQAKSQHEYITDIEQHSKLDHWRPKLTGDCEDFALWCDKELNKHGIDYGEYVLCYTETNECHLVLSVKGYILDNRQRFVMNNADLKYKWASIFRNNEWLEIK